MSASALYVDDSEDDISVDSVATASGVPAPSVLASPIALASFKSEKDEDGLCELFHIKPNLDLNMKGVEGLALVVHGFHERDITDIFYNASAGTNSKKLDGLACIRRLFTLSIDGKPVNNSNNWPRKLICWLFDKEAPPQTEESVLAFFDGFIKKKLQALLKGNRAEKPIRTSKIHLRTLSTWSDVMPSADLEMFINKIFRIYAVELKGFYKMQHSNIYSIWAPGDVPSAVIVAHSLKKKHLHSRDHVTIEEERVKRAEAKATRKANAKKANAMAKAMTAQVPVEKMTEKPLVTLAVIPPTPSAFPVVGAAAELPSGSAAAKARAAIMAEASPAKKPDSTKLFGQHDSPPQKKKAAVPANCKHHQARHRRQGRIPRY